MSAAPVLYLTFDPVLEPLGYSQVVRLVVALALRGVPYTLLSVERHTDLQDPERVRRVEDTLRAAGVRWIRVPAGTARQSARRSAAAWARVARHAFALASAGQVALVHARGAQPAAIAYGLQKLLGTPYLFDARGYWIDERSGPGDWFFRAGPYAAGKLAEHEIVGRSAAMVTLTALHAADVRARFRGEHRLVEAIPTCADYDAFPLRASRPAKPSASSVIPEAVRRALEGKTVLGIVGSLNRFYLGPESIFLAKLATEMSSSVHLVILSKQTDDYLALLERADFPRERVTVAAATHEEMPGWLQWLDWGLMLLEDTSSKRGSMPTKLAEFFASGVRTVAFGCNAEVTGWVRRAGSGHVLDEIDPASLRQAAAVVAGPPGDHATLLRARERTEPHFGLSRGADRYADLVRRALASRDGWQDAPPPLV